MRLLNGTLRCLPALFTAKLNPKCLVSLSYPAAVVRQQRRNITYVTAIDMSHDVYDAPSLDVSRSPLITMHGLFGSRQNWRSISKVLAMQTNRRVFAVDMRNHGDSAHTSSHDSDGMTADIFTFAQTRSLSKISLMGHSMGGRAAMHFALTHPHLTDRLIVVDISPVSIPGSVVEMGSIFEAMSSVSLSSSMSLSQGRQMAKEVLLETIDAGSVDFILLNLRKRPQTGEFYWACNVDILMQSLPGFRNFSSQISHLPPFMGPTTFICGTHSPYMNPNDWPEVLRVFPNASLYWLDTGHLVHLEETHQFIEIVATFLNER